MKNGLMICDGFRYFFDCCLMFIIVFLMLKCNEIWKFDILFMDMSVNMFKMVKLYYFYFCRVGYYLGVLLYNFDVDILEEMLGYFLCYYYNVKVL